MPQCEYVSSSTGVRCGNSSTDIKLDSRNYCEIHGFVNYIYDNIVSAKQHRLSAPPKLEIKITDVRGNVHDKIGWVGSKDDEEMLRCSSDWLQYNNFEADDNMFYENFSGTTIHGCGPFTELEVLKNQEILINEEIKMLEKLRRINDEELASKNAFYRHAMLQELCSGAFVIKTPEEVRLCGEIQDLYKYGSSKEREHKSLPFYSNVYRIQKETLKKAEDEYRNRSKREISETLSDKGDDTSEEEDWYSRTCCLESLENGKCNEVVLWPSAYCHKHLKFDKNQLLYELCQECQNPYIPLLECTNCLTNKRVEKSKQLISQNPRMMNVRPNFDIRRNIPTMRMKGFDSSIVIPIRKMSVKMPSNITSQSKFELKHVNGEVETDLNGTRNKELLEDTKENIVFTKDSGDREIIELIDNYFSEVRLPVKQLPTKSITQVPQTVTLPDRRHNPFTNVNKPPMTLPKPVGILNPINQKFTRGPQRTPRRMFEAIRHHPVLSVQFKQNPCARIRPFTREYFPASEGSLHVSRRPYITTGNNVQKIKMIVMKPVVTNSSNPHSAPPRSSGAFYFRNTRTTK